MINNNIIILIYNIISFNYDLTYSHLYIYFFSLERDFLWLDMIFIISVEKIINISWTVDVCVKEHLGNLNLIFWVKNIIDKNESKGLTKEQKKKYLKYLW